MARSELYRVKIRSRTLDAPIRGWLPEEFSFGVESEWEPLFPSAVGGGGGFLGNLNLLATATGNTLKTASQTSQAWAGSSPVEFSLPIDFVAVSDANKEVVTPIKNLMSLALPGTHQDRGGLLLDPPGPIFAETIPIDEFRSISSFRGDKITLKIGKFIMFTNVIISSVSANWMGKLSPEGEPMQAQAEVTIRTYTMLTKEELERAFVGG